MRRILLLYILLSVIGLTTVHAQFDNGRQRVDENGYDQYGNQVDPAMIPDRLDSANVEVQGLPPKLYMWRIKNQLGDRTIIPADTAFHHFQNSNLTEGLTGHYNYLANMGSPRMSRIFFDRRDPEPTIFMKPFSSFFIRPTEFNFTNSNVPYTNLTYHKAGNKVNGEERFKSYFSVNVNKKLAFGFNVDYLYGRGYYNNQNTAYFNAAVFGSYIGDKYQMQAIYSNNYLKTNENGGIEDDQNTYFDTDNPNVRDSTTYVGIKNTIGIALLEGFNKYAKAGLTAFASYKISKYTLMNMEGNPLPDKYNENEIFVGGELSKREGNVLHYHAIGEVGLAGKAIGQFNVKGDIDLNFPLWKDTVSLIARGEVSNKLAPFYMRHYHSKHFMWDDDMDKEFRTRIEGELSIARWRTRLKAGVENIKNYTYFNQEAKPEQNSGSIQVLSASLNQDFKLGIFHLDNEVTWQKSSDQTVLPLPDLSLYHNFYMQFKLAKKVLSVQLGADVRYFSKYNAPAYMPAIQNFHLQPTDDQVQIGGYPIVNVYANLHLKRTRFYVMMYHVNQGMSSPNYFLSPHYPINPRVLKFGLSWNFYD